MQPLKGIGNDVMTPQHGSLPGTELPFIVYASDSPSYSNMELDYRGASGRRELPGSVVVVSGGYILSDDKLVFMYGCMDMWGRIGNRFAERVVVALIQPDDRVTILYYISRMETAIQMKQLRNFGFQVY